MSRNNGSKLHDACVGPVGVWDVRQEVGVAQHLAADKDSTISRLQQEPLELHEAHVKQDGAVVDNDSDYAPLSEDEHVTASSSAETKKCVRGKSMQERDWSSPI